ncbi:MAG: membrane dipeptidase [Acidobacteria bacterium]|nr:membrane dipeptidase [Acidobacteriota bacterium]
MRLLFCLFFSAALHAQAIRYSDVDVMRIHRSLLLIDTHNDVTSFTVEGMNIAQPQPKRHTDVPKLRQGNVGAVFFAVYVAAKSVEGNHAAHRTLEMIDTVRTDIIARHPKDFQLATTADEIVAARKAGRIAALLGIEGGHAIEDSLRLLRTYRDLGVRYMTLTHSNNNNWADSSGDVPRHNGLTRLGRDVVAGMNRLGMMVDISHVADRTFYDVLQSTKAPVFASHSSCRALSNIPRNMTDDMIRALARNGGVIQINFGCEFLSQASADSSSWSNPKVKPGARTTRAKLSDVVSHIRHVIKIAGVDHAGIGSDFDGVPCTPEGLDDVSKFPNLTRALLESGLTATDIEKVYGGNLLRVMRAVEKTATELSR